MRYDLGDVARLALTLRDPDTGALADATVELTMRNPDQVETTPPVQHPGVGKYHADVALDMVGTWRSKWVASGAVAATEHDALIVTESWTYPVPWVPGLPEVADYIPSRTVAQGVGTQTPADTFTTDTTPTDVQASRVTAAATSYVAAKVGTLHDTLTDMARSVAAMRAAGLIELSYPERDDDVNVAEQLLAAAREALEVLVEANNETGGGSPSDPSNLLPVWTFPPPVWWGDESVL
ncbi:MAG: hypothetical protein ACRDUA_08955 [Micromonosporaceae bacterium]